MGAGIVQRRAAKALRRRAVVKERRRTELANDSSAGGLTLWSEPPVWSACKLSDALVDIAEPLLPDDADFNSVHNWFVLAMFGWNLALLPVGRRREEMGEMFKTIPGVDEHLALGDRSGSSSLLSALEASVAALIARKEALYPFDRRWIIDFEMMETLDSYRLRVTSVLGEVP